MKLKWQVGAVPTGRYRSFQRRCWPSARYADGSIAVQIHCDADYVPTVARSGNHPALQVWIADHRETPWKWRRLKAEYSTLAEAKKAVGIFLADGKFAPAEGKV